MNSAYRSPLTYQKAAVTMYAAIKRWEREPVRKELQAPAVGEAAFVVNPFELFSACGVAIRNAPLPHDVVRTASA